MVARSVVVTPALQRGLIGDATRFALVSRAGLTVPVVGAVILAVGIVTAIGGGDHGSLGVAVPLAGAVLVVLFPFLVRRNMRRAVVAGFPVGSTVSAEVLEDTLHVEAARGAGDTDWAAFRDVRATRRSGALRQRSSSILVILPRELFTTVDLERLRSRITQ